MGTQNTRQLAAVMFTDIEGYTAMMQEDEENASEQSERHRQVLEERAADFDGKPMHYYGDGALTIFSSAFNAVMCAIEIQKELHEPFLPVRIGIHMGDIAYNQNEVFGDAVNIAARLEALSKAGGIVISEKVKDEIRNHPDLQTSPLGSFELKNVKQPIQIYAVSNEGIEVPTHRDIEKKTGRTAKRIAVLPFVNMSEEVGFDYFSDGLTEEIISGLTSRTELEVTSRTSAFAFKDTSEDVRAIGEKLSVSHILEGSVRKNKDRIRVTAQLIETNDGFHLWSETFDGHLKDIFEIQDTISEGILERFEQGERQALKESPQPSRFENDKRSYEYYLEGKFEWNKGTVPAIEKSIPLFKKAIERDPDFSRAYVDLANSYCHLGIAGYGPARLAFEKSSKFLIKANSMAGSSAESSAVKGLVDAFYHRDYEAANTSFRRALHTDNSAPRVFHHYAIFLNAIGHNHEAIPWMERALQLDPMNLNFNVQLGRTFYLSGQYRDALEQFDYTLELEASHLPALDGKGWAYVAMDQPAKAREAFEMYQNLVSMEQKNIPQLVYLAARCGRDKKARRGLEQLQLGDSEDQYAATPLDIALISLGMGKSEEVFFHLQRAVDDDIGKVLFVDSDPVWDSIKSHDRYASLKKRLGLDTEVDTLELPPL